MSAQSGWRVSWGSFRVEGGARCEPRAGAPACLWQGSLKARLKALERTGAADAATRARAFTLGMDLAIEALLACYSDEGLARWEAHGAQGALSESRDGWFACQGDLRLPTSQPSEHKLQKTPHGLASPRAGAIEAAWRAYRRSQHRRAVAEALEAAASAPSDQRSVLVAQALERATRDVGPSSLRGSGGAPVGWCVMVRCSRAGDTRAGASASRQRDEARRQRPGGRGDGAGALCGLRALGFEAWGGAQPGRAFSAVDVLEEHARLMGCEVACLEEAWRR